MITIPITIGISDRYLKHLLFETLLTKYITNPNVNKAMDNIKNSNIKSLTSCSTYSMKIKTELCKERN